MSSLIQLHSSTPFLEISNFFAGNYSRRYSTVEAFIIRDILYSNWNEKSNKNELSVESCLYIFDPFNLKGYFPPSTGVDDSV